MALEIFLIDLMGSELIQANYDLRNALFGMDWTERDLKFKKIMVMFQQRMQYFLKLQIGHIFNVDLIVFRKVGRTSLGGTERDLNFIFYRFA